MPIRAKEKGQVHGVKVASNAPSIFHVFYADDKFLFCKASFSEGREIKMIPLKVIAHYVGNLLILINLWCI